MRITDRQILSRATLNALKAPKGATLRPETSERASAGLSVRFKEKPRCQPAVGAYQSKAYLPVFHMATAETVEANSRGGMRLLVAGGLGALIAAAAILAGVAAVRFPRELQARVTEDLKGLQQQVEQTTLQTSELQATLGGAKEAAAASTSNLKLKLDEAAGQASAILADKLHRVPEQTSADLKAALDPVVKQLSEISVTLEGVDEALHNAAVTQELDAQNRLPGPVSNLLPDQLPLPEL